MSDQREEYRFSRRATVMIELPNEKQGYDWVACRVVDFSGGGMQVQLGRPLVNGQVVRLRFHEGYGVRPLEVVAEVRWQKQEAQSARIGLSLYMADQTDIQLWKEFVARQLV